MRCAYYVIFDIHSKLKNSAIINEAVGIVAMMLCYFFVSRLGRRSSLMCSFGFSILCGLLSALLENWERYDISHWVNFVAMGVSNGSLCIFLLYLPELFPTSVRVSGIGVVSFISRGGGILAPQLVHMARSPNTWYIANMFLY